MNSIARTCSRLLGIGVGAAIGGPLVGAAGGVLGDALHDLVGDAFGDNPNFRSDITSLLGNITASAFPSLFFPPPDYKDFNHNFRRGLLEALIKALREKVPTTYVREVGWSDAKHALIRRCLKVPADHIESQLKYALKQGDKTTFHALFPPGAVDKTLLDLQDDSALVGDLLGKWYDSVIAPVIAAECARDLPHLGGAEEFRMQTLAALAIEFPAAFSSLLKEEKNQRLRIATDRLLTNATRQLLAQLPTQISGLDEKLTQIGDSLTTQLNRLEGKIDDLARQLTAVQQAISELQQKHNPETDPIRNWPKERLEQELARQMDMSVDDLRAILTAGKTRLDALLQGQALLASGQAEEAGQKFDLVIQEERAALQRLKQAYEGKAQIAWDAVRYQEALDYRQKAAALVDKDIDPLGWCDAQGHVSFILHQLALYKEAEPLMQEIVRLREQHQGPNHAFTAIAFNNLATLLKTTKRLEEAELMMRRVAIIFEAVYGNKHPIFGTALNNLAQLLKVTNRLAEAEMLMQRALEIDEASYGPDHPEVANALNNLAQLLQAMKRLEEAEPLMWRALGIVEALYGPDHPKGGIRLNNLAGLYKDTNRPREAEPLMRRALKIDEASYGPDHPNVARDLNNLAQVLQAMSRLAEAEPIMRRAVGIFAGLKHSTGHEHQHFSGVVGNYIGLLDELKLSKEEILMRFWEIGLTG